jgi:hypothetical protein
MRLPTPDGPTRFTPRAACVLIALASGACGDDPAPSPSGSAAVQQATPATSLRDAGSGPEDPSERRGEAASTTSSEGPPVVSLGDLARGDMMTRPSADAGALSDAGGPTGPDAEAASECPGSGSVVYRLNGDEGWPEDVRERLTAAMDEAVAYYNCYSNLSHSLTVNYNAGVPTAEANVDGWMTFGANRGYMVVATAMHEVAHTLGVGYFPWSELIVDGRWTGAAVVDLMSTLPAQQRDPDAFSQRDFITADAQHFWPYGLNQAAEHQSEWSLINNVRIVAAMNEDKQAYRDSQQ